MLFSIGILEENIVGPIFQKVEVSNVVIYLKENIIQGQDTSRKYFRLYCLTRALEIIVDLCPKFSHKLSPISKFFQSQ